MTREWDETRWLTSQLKCAKGTDYLRVRDIWRASEDDGMWPDWPGGSSQRGLYLLHGSSVLDGERPLYIGKAVGNAIGFRVSVHLGLREDEWGHDGCTDYRDAVKWCKPKSFEWLVECIPLDVDSHALGEVEEDLIHLLYPRFNTMHAREYPFPDDCPDWLTAMWKKQNDDVMEEVLRMYAQPLRTMVTP